MFVRTLMIACCELRLATGYIPPEQFRHEQITSMQSAFSRFSAQGLEGAIAKHDLPDFLQFVVGSMNSRVLPEEQALSRGADLSAQLMAQLPSDVSPLHMSDLCWHVFRAHPTPPL